LRCQFIDGKHFATENQENPEPETTAQRTGDQLCPAFPECAPPHSANGFNPQL
jgi:hypothetical protein